MCGIVCVMRKDGKPAHKQVLKRYSKQEERGSDGFGYIALDNRNVVVEYKRYQYEKEVRNALTKSNSSYVLFHHRFPTSTINLPESAHPIRVRHKELTKTYYVVHNGVISNPKELRVAHEKLGYKYTTEVQSVYRTKKGKEYYGEAEFNDSEALAIELARTLEGLQPRVNAIGSIAYIVLEVDKSKNAVALYYGTNGGNPLTVEDTSMGICIASEGGRAILANTCYRLDLTTKDTSVVLLPMQTYSVLKSYYNSGIDYTGYQSGMYDDYDDEYTAKEFAETYTPSTLPTERETEAQYLQQAIDECKECIAIAEQCEEAYELEELQIELQALNEEMLSLFSKKKLGF